MAVKLYFLNNEISGGPKFTMAAPKQKNIASIYEIVTDYSHLQFYDRNGDPMPQSNEPFDKEFHKKIYEYTLS